MVLIAFQYCAHRQLDWTLQTLSGAWVKISLLALESAKYNNSDCIKTQHFFFSILDLTLQKIERIEGGQEVAIQICAVLAALGTLALGGYLYYKYKRTHRYDVVV